MKNCDLGIVNMFAVGRLGSYISRGVSTVSRPLQPFGGAVDIIVVEQPDGTFKSCPWYVRFGKSQAGLRPEEKVVRVNVNDVDADFYMYLDNNGDAYLLKEVDEAESFASFGDENVLSPRIRRMQKSRSCDYDANRTHLVSEFEAANGNMLTRANSRQGALFGLSFGGKSNTEGDSWQGQGTAGATNSLERAEMAADLLEVRWTTNLGTGEKWKANPPQVPKPKLPVAGDAGKVGVEGAPNTENSLMNGHHDKMVDSFVSDEATGAFCTPGCVQSTSKKETDAEGPCSVIQGNDAEVCSLEETHVVVVLASNGSEVPYGVADGTIDKDRNAERDISAISASGLKVSCLLESAQNEGCSSSGEEHSCTGNAPGGGSLMENESRTNNVGCSNSTSHVTEVNVMPQLGEGNGQSNGSELVTIESMKDLNDQLSLISSEQVCTVLTSEVDTKSNQNPYPGALPRQHEDTKEDHAEYTACCNAGEKTLGNLTQSDNSEEQQFSFSDLDDCKINKVDQVGVSSPDDGKECLPLDSTQSSEEDVTEAINTAGAPPRTTGKLIQDDQFLIRPSPKFKSKEVSRPISIPSYHKEVEEELITLMTESLPCMHKLRGPQRLSRSLDSNLEAMRMVNDDAQVCPQSGVHSTPNGTEISEEIKSILSDPAVEVSLCRHLLYEGMGYEAAAVAFDAEKLAKDKFTSLAPDIVQNDRLVVRIGGLYFPWDAALPIASAIGSQGREQILEAEGMIAVGQVDKSSEGITPQKNMNPRNGSWKLWPFSFKRTNTAANISTESPSGNTMEKYGGGGMDGNSQKDGSTKEDEDTEKDTSTEKEENAENGESTDVAGSTVTKRKIRAKTPTSEQLAALKLKEGKNIVTFTFSTEALGNQQVDARIFLWKWDTRIVISDVDGTITKSDVLGHVMPLMGIDWSQTGVTHLFSAIKENGYQLLFLSARSILQASQTRQFLISLKQDGKSLPEGPIVISPDGLFPSLYREVIRRAPHEFKIACLEDIKALFPRDHSPFYAGFGNRDTDELSYLKVGIPRGKIFTINPKGEVAVNRRVDTKSYTSLHALVHDMFPPTPVIEQEDYNSWNFWRLPPPDVGI